MALQSCLRLKEESQIFVFLNQPIAHHETLSGRGHNLGQSSLLQPRAVLCEECSCELQEAAAPASEEGSVCSEQRIRQSLRGATIYGVTEKSSNTNQETWALGLALPKLWVLRQMSPSLWTLGATITK